MKDIINKRNYKQQISETLNPSANVHQHACMDMPYAGIFVCLHSLSEHMSERD